jgi:hypothetical protein
MRLGRFLAIALLVCGCRRAHQVGDHILVEWRNADYPAVIVAIEAPARFRVHYDGYSDDWDESITTTRIKGRLSAAVSPVSLPAPAPVRGKPGPSGSASSRPPPEPPSVYRAGDRVRVEWHGAIYPAAIIAVLGDDRYRVHYEGYGDEWDESIGLNRIQRKK